MPVPKCFIPNPTGFLDVIDVPEGASGRFRVALAEAPAGKKFDTAPMRSALLGGQKSHVFSYDHPTHWHQLLERAAGKSGDGTEGLWMTTLPCEQMQAMDGIARMHGRVLVGGLGLGMVVNMLCARPRVKTVTVVEREADVVKLVEPYLRRAGKTVEVVCEDLYEYLDSPQARKKLRKNGEARSFDSAFFDIWGGDGVATLYSHVIPLLYRANRLGIRNVSCWQEDVMRGQVQLGVMAQLAMQLDRIGAPDTADLWGYAAQLAKVRMERSRLDAPMAAALIARDFGVPGFEFEYGTTPFEMQQWMKPAEKLRG